MNRAVSAVVAPSRADLAQRAATVVAGVLLVAAALVSRPGVLALVGCAAFVSGWEYRVLTAPWSRRAGRFVSGLAGLGCAAACVAVVGARPWFAGPMIAGVLLLFLPGMVAPRRAAAARWIAGPLYFGALPAFLALLRQGDHGVAWVAVVLAATWGGSIGAYAIGRTLGRHPLAPGISPAKTVEGALGGLVFGTALAFAVSGGAIPWTTLAWIAPLAQALAQAGDLAESRLKRLCGAKDSGSLLGAQGGMLDCVDGLCLAAPFVYIASGLVRG